ncbi:jasmonate-induced oxygenase 4 [Syzygium oleosum]|uniref:jasmonate-induced oxygenase 4 n=1 Tax=Syzygium oleosum TaxID=219896 RepID=UPI0011D21E9F|nr:jasmonate-induced oxygenase 4 [Syzygium oleosum]
MAEVEKATAARVQAIAHSNQPHVPPQYIQPPHTRPFCSPPSSSAAAAGIPAIDLSGLDPTRRDRDRDHVRAEIGRACRGWGAFHVTNHGVPGSLLGRARAVGSSFFGDLSMGEKLAYACDPSSSATEGYGSRMLESDDSVLDWRDYFDHHTLPLSRRDPSRWPSLPPDYREVMAEYSDRMGSLAKQLLGLISESLGLPTSCIEHAVGEFYQNITISYYPPCPQPDLTLGLQAHSDMGAITLLIQDDVGGLQVLKDGEWITVEPLSDAIVVLLADQTEIMTNGIYRSAEHWAITNARRARLSIATFHDPSKARKISPISELVSDSSPPRYREVVYGDYVSSWYTKGPEGKRNIDALLL